MPGWIIWMERNTQDCLVWIIKLKKLESRILRKNLKVSNNLSCKSQLHMNYWKKTLMELMIWWTKELGKNNMKIICKRSWKKRMKKKNWKHQRKVRKKRSKIKIKIRTKEIITMGKATKHKKKMRNKKRMMKKKRKIHLQQLWLWWDCQQLLNLKNEIFCYLLWRNGIF